MFVVSVHVLKPWKGEEIQLNQRLGNHKGIAGWKAIGKKRQNINRVRAKIPKQS
jgi:hypothetical protein